MGLNTDIDTIKFELEKPQADYSTAKIHAISIDQLLGYECVPIENFLFGIRNSHILQNNRQFWIGLDLQSFQTPYSEIVEMIQYLNPKSNEVWMDLGAAYGRVGVVLGFLRPSVQFKGYEFIEERVNEGKRIFAKWNLRQAEIKKADLASDDFLIEDADLYFIYDFGSKNDVYLVMEKLRQVAQRGPIKVIARGRGVRNWIQMDFPWLSQVQAPEHFTNWSLFRS